jgi:hypothetical protein
LLWLIPVGVLVLTAGWIGIRGWIAKENLEAARMLVSELRTQASAMALPEIPSTFAALSERTATARSLTSDPVWRLGELVPWAGENLRVVRELAELTDDVVIALDPVVDLTETLDPAVLAPVDGAVPLEPFLDAAPLVRDLAATFVTIEARAGAIDATGTIGPIADARAELVALIGEAAPGIASAGELVPLLPALLGAETPRTYVVMFQNNAEPRSLGGTALSFALVTIDAGRIQLQQTVPTGGNFPLREDPILPVPDGFGEIFPGAFGQYVPNATTRPSSVTASQQVYEEWRLSRGVTADGVLSIDAVTLGYLLRATGPITLSTGDVLESSTVTGFLLNTVLQRFDTGDVLGDNAAQDQIYGEAVAQTFAKLSGGAFDVPTLASAIMQGFAERRMTFWSPDEDEQASLFATGLSHDLPESDETTDRIGVYVNDNVGSKLGFYQTATLTTASGVCSDDGRQVHRVVVGLYSLLDPALAPGLSPSILGQYVREGLQPGVQRTMLFVYAPPGSTILGATVEGKPVTLHALHDTDHPVARLVVLVEPATSAIVIVDIAMGEPGERDVEVEMTPLVVPTQRSVETLDCSTVAAD